MPYTIEPLTRNQAIPSFYELLAPAYEILPHTPTLESKGDRQLQMTFEHQFKALIYYHLEEHSSGSHQPQRVRAIIIYFRETSSSGRPNTAKEVCLSWQHHLY